MSNRAAAGADVLDLLSGVGQVGGCHQCTEETRGHVFLKRVRNDDGGEDAWLVLNRQEVCCRACGALMGPTVTNLLARASCESYAYILLELWGRVYKRAGGSLSEGMERLWGDAPCVYPSGLMWENVQEACKRAAAREPA